MYKHSWGAPVLHEDHFEQDCATCPSRRLVGPKFTTVIKAHSAYKVKTSKKNGYKLAALIRYPHGFRPGMDA